MVAVFQEGGGVSLVAWNLGGTNESISAEMMSWVGRWVELVVY